MRIGVREIVFLLVLLVVPVASYIYVFKPRNAQIDQVQKEVHVKKAKLDRLNEVSSRIDDINLAIQQGRKAIELIESKLPSEQDVEVILEDVWKMARRSNLTVKSVKSQKQVSAATYMEQPLSVEMEGSFDGFYQFLQDLENLPRITRIHQLHLEQGSRRGGRDEKGDLTADFILSIYFQPRP